MMRGPARLSLDILGSDGPETDVLGFPRACAVNKEAHISVL